MHEPDAWWDHVPVVSQSYSKNLGEDWDWHKRQLDEALTEISGKRANALVMIPETGFYIMAARKIQKYLNGQPDELLTVVTLWEDDHCVVYPKHAASFIVVRGGVTHQALSGLGSNENPFMQMFEQLALNAPKEWPEFLKARRRLHWNPVPEWLVNLRREERNAKRRKPSEPPSITT
jgi:hypothetical protein